MVLLAWFALGTIYCGTFLVSLASASSEWPPYRTVVGPQRVIVITVEFPDVKHKMMQTYIEDLIFHKIDSYYREASYNQCWITGNITKKWYQMPKESSVYDWDGKSNPQPYMSPFIQQVVNFADEEVDYSKYRYIVILHPAGWRNNWGFMASQSVSTHEGSRTVNVTIISEHEPMSVFAHEFGHIFGGLPDMYGKIGGEYLPIFAGPWDLMSQTDSRYTQHFSAWSKIKIGWIQRHAVAAASRGRVANATIDPLELPTSGIQALKVPLTASTYYMVEARQRIGFDSSLPDYGVVVYFVDETKTEWGESPLAVQDSNPSTSTLDDATFDLRVGKQAGFFDRKNDISVVINRKSAQSYALFVGRVDQGEAILKGTEKLLAAIIAIDGAKASIQKAETEGRTEGIDKARSLLVNASAAFDRGDYDVAIMLAQQLVDLASKAIAPLVVSTTTTVGRTTTQETPAAPESTEQTVLSPLSMNQLLVGAAIGALAAIGVIVILYRRKRTSR